MSVQLQVAIEAATEDDLAAIENWLAPILDSHDAIVDFVFSDPIPPIDISDDFTGLIPVEG